MLPIRLEIKNFLAFRSPDALRFDGIHLACITGANGAGKSSLLDAITWALWGEARGKRDEEIIHQGQGDMSVQFDFEQEGTIYRVLRRRTRKGSTGSLDLFVIKEEGDLETRSEGTVKATQAKINALLRLNHETFVNSAFLQQGKADAFTTKTPGRRKQLLAEILGLDRWNQYEDTVKDRLRVVDENISMVSSVIEQINADLASEPALKKALADAEAAQQSAQIALEAARERVKAVENAPADLKAALIRRADLDQQIQGHEKEMHALEAEIARREARIADYEKVLAQRDTITEGFAALKAAREADHSLGDKLRQLSDLDTRRRALERRLDAAKAELEGQISGARAAMRQLEQTIRGGDADQLAEITAELQSLAGLDERRQTAEIQRGDLEQEQADKRAQNKTMKAEMDELKERLDRLKAAEGVECPLCGQPLDAEHRALLIEQIQAEGTRRGDLYRANLTRTAEIDQAVVSIKGEVKALEKDEKHVNELQRKAAVLQTTARAADEARQQYDARAAEADALTRTLEANDYAHELREQLNALDEERAALGYDRDQHDSAREQLSTFSAFEEQQKQLELAEQSLPDLHEARENAQHRLDKHQADLTTAREALAFALTDIGQKEALVKEFNARDQEMRTQEAAERAAHGRVIEARQELNVLQTQRDRKAKKEKEREELRSDRAMLDDLKLAFGKNGVPALVIDTAIPELETAANRLLSKMTDGRMALTITTQREKITGGTAETLDIHIADELGTRSYEMFSGGEAFRINFAIRVALSQMLARRAGAHLSTLFIDEGFGTQDDEGRTKLVDAINAVQDDFDLILVITHIEELRDSFPVHIALEKSSEGSQIRVR